MLVLYPLSVRLYLAGYSGRCGLGKTPWKECLHWGHACHLLAAAAAGHNTSLCFRFLTYMMVTIYLMICHEN